MHWFRLNCAILSTLKRVARLELWLTSNRVCCTTKYDFDLIIGIFLIVLWPLVDGYILRSIFLYGIFLLGGCCSKIPLSPCVLNPHGSHSTTVRMLCDCDRFWNEYCIAISAVGLSRSFGHR